MQATPISFRMASDGTSDLESVIVWKGHGTHIMSYSIICMVIKVGINKLMKDNKKNNKRMKGDHKEDKRYRKI